MANYLATARTNYFRVTDEERYQKLFEHLVAGDEVKDLTKERDGVLYHGFGAYGSIDWQENEEADCDFNHFLEELQKILPDDEAFIYQEVGHEKLHSVDGYGFVVTSKEIRAESISSWAKEMVEELLGKDNRVTACES